MNKSILKKDYYWEYIDLYETLPEELEPLEYTEQVLTKKMSHKEILSELKPTQHSMLDAFRVACTLIPNLKKDDDKLIYFMHDNLECRLGVWRRDDGIVQVYVCKVSPGREFGASVGVLSSNKTLETLEPKTPCNSETLCLERAIGICVMNGYSVKKQD